MSKFPKFLYWLSGADPDIVSRLRRSERLKHEAIGLVVLLSGLYALIAGSVLTQRAFGGNALAMIGGGIFWAYAIVTIERVTLIAIGRAASWFGKALSVIWRLLLACLLSLAISMPFELLLFADRIAMGRQQMQDNEIGKSRTAIERALGVGDYRSAETASQAEVVKLRAEIASPRASELLSVLRNGYDVSLEEERRVRGEVVNEVRAIDDRIASTRNAFFNLNQQLRREDLDEAIAVDLRRQRAVLQTRVATLTRSRADVLGRLHAAEEKTRDALRQLNEQAAKEDTDRRAALDDATARRNADAEKRNEAEAQSARRLQTSDAAIKKGLGQNLLADYQALGWLKKQDNSVWWMALVLQLVILSFETGPVLAKMAMKDGSYEIELQKDRVEETAKLIAWETVHIEEQDGLHKEEANARVEREVNERWLRVLIETYETQAQNLLDFLRRNQEHLRGVQRLSKKYPKDSDIPADAAEMVEAIAKKFKKDFLAELNPEPPRPTGTTGENSADRVTRMRFDR